MLVQEETKKMSQMLKNQKRQKHRKNQNGKSAGTELEANVLQGMKLFQKLTRDRNAT